MKIYNWDVFGNERTNKSIKVKIKRKTLRENMYNHGLSYTNKLLWSIKLDKWIVCLFLFLTKKLELLKID